MNARSIFFHPESAVLYLFLFGVAIGIISGLLGIGGGILLVPGLMLLFQFSQQEAQGTSFAVLIPPIGIFAALVYIQNGDVKLPVAGTIAAGYMLGALGGALLVPHVPAYWLRLGFGGLLLYLGLTFVLGAYLPKQAAALPAVLAALLVAIGAWLHGRRAAIAAKLPPPDGQTEYHI